MVWIVMKKRGRCLVVLTFYTFSTQFVFRTIRQLLRLLRLLRLRHVNSVRWNLFKSANQIIYLALLMDRAPVIGRRNPNKNKRIVFAHSAFISALSPRLIS
jgi:hypothetical protein